MEPETLVALVSGFGIGVAIPVAILLVQRHRRRPPEPLTSGNPGSLEPCDDTEASAAAWTAIAELERTSQSLADRLGEVAARLALVEFRVERAEAGTEGCNPDRLPAPLPPRDGDEELRKRQEQALTPFEGSIDAKLASAAYLTAPSPRRTACRTIDRAVDIRSHAARGRTAIEIAQLVGADVGEVELILRLDGR